MIKCKEGQVKIKGTGNDVLTELSCLVKQIKQMFVEKGMDEEIANKLIDESVDVGKMSNDQLKEKMISLLKENFGVEPNTEDTFNKFFNGRGDVD